MTERKDHDPDAATTVDDGNPLEDRREFLKTATTLAAGAAAAVLTPTSMQQQDDHSAGQHRAHGHETRNTPDALPEHQAGKLYAERAESHDAEATLNEQGCHCVDGRGKERKTYGLVGGDLGPASAVLATVEKLTGKRVDTRAAAAVLRVLPKMYIHTDAHAMEALHHTLKSNPAYKELAVLMKDEHALESLVEEGPATIELKEMLAELLTDPKHVGCGHMKQIITQTEEGDNGPYGMRPELGRTVLAAAYLNAWQQPEHAVVESLEGNHGEAAVFAVSIKGGLRKGSNALPTVQPCAPDAGGKDVQTFVNHADIGTLRIEQLVDAVIRQMPELRGQEAVLREQAGTLLQAHTNETVSRLAKGRPLFAVTVDPEKPGDLGTPKLVKTI